MKSYNKILEINGRDFENMVRNGLANLSQRVDEVNALNVFPVPDGDTGSNMFMTLRNAVDRASSEKDLCLYLRELSRTMLYGARGNSGVILSQLFRGLAEALASKDEVDSPQLCAAFVAAYRAAYASVQRPVEGTILTVAREGIDNISGRIGRGTTVDQLLSWYVAEMRRSLSKTPQLLPALREAGVVDSGGMGYILIVEGMLKSLRGEVVACREPKLPPMAAPASDTFSSFTADSEFLFGYCMEFLLQILDARTQSRPFDEASFSRDLEAFGDSVAVIYTGDKVKVHVHTKTPAKVIELAQSYGEFLSFKLENMHLQHSQFIQPVPQKKHHPLAVLAVCHGAGLQRLYSEFDFCLVIEGGEMQNVSCEEFLNAFDRIDADCIAVLPNNKNTISAAHQAARLSTHPNICILPTTNVVQGYQALSMDIPEDSVASRLESLQENVKSIVTLSFAQAVRSCVINGEACRAGDYLGFLNGRAVGSHSDAGQLLLNVLNSPNIPEPPEYLQIYLGKGMTEELVEPLKACVREAYPGVEIECIESGQAVYTIIISIM